MANSSTISSLPISIESEFQFLADFIPQLVWITDPTGFHLYFNQRWVDYTGYTLADSVGPDMWNNLLHPDDRARARQIWGHSLATGEDYEIEYRFKSQAGDYRWFLGQARPRRDAEGNIVVWFGTCTDINDQKLASEQLAERETEFATLADNMTQMAWMTHPDGHIYWYNKRWYDFTGTTLAQMQGWGWQAAMHPDHVDRVTESINRGFASGQEWEDTYPIKAADGSFRWFLSRAAPYRDGAGQVVRWLGTNTDVTEMRHLQEQLQNSYADLEAKVTFRNLELEHEVQDLRKQLGQ